MKKIQSQLICNNKKCRNVTSEMFVAQNQWRKMHQRNHWLSLITSDLKEQRRVVDSTKIDGFSSINYSRTYWEKVKHFHRCLLGILPIYMRQILWKSCRKLWNSRKQSRKHPSERRKPNIDKRQWICSDNMRD